MERGIWSEKAGMARKVTAARIAARAPKRWVRADERGEFEMER